MGDTTNWLGWATLLSVPITAVVVTGLNVWANQRVQTERDRAHELAIGDLKTLITSGDAATRQTLANFGARIGEVHEEMVEMRSGLGIGKDHGLFAEVRELRRAVDLFGSSTASVSERVARAEQRIVALERESA